jgi:hypothetical protein
MSKKVVPAGRIAAAIHIIRGQKVMLDFDLAALYGVATRVLNQAVGRNATRFPGDFMFRLTLEEIGHLRSQSVTLKRGEHRKYLPYAFTEQGVAMLSSVLRSERAVQVNIAIMRAFVQLRSALESNRELARKFSELEERVGKHDEDIAAIIEAIRQLIAPEIKQRREIGFHARESPPRYGKRRRR